MSTIVAVSTPPGSGGIAVIRVSGHDAIDIVGKCWRGTNLSLAKTHTVHLGDLLFADGSVLDKGVATIFRGPKSYTGEDTVELSVHGSKWIQHQLINRLVELGAEVAGPGEFTRRAFINGRLDLAQAEGVADLIAASSRAAHRLAISQMSGTFSARLDSLREKLVELASLLELELDFSEEEVEFADRTKLQHIIDETLRLMLRLADTYKSGRAFKEGVPVAIAGLPNAGKSTLLNALLDEDKAIVSDIPGTTRDVIEDTVEFNGILFRFFDTAGIRTTSDCVELMGIDRAMNAISKAAIVLWVIDSALDDNDIAEQLQLINSHINAGKDSKHIVVFNKTDCSNRCNGSDIEGIESINIAAKIGQGLESLKSRLAVMAVADHNPDNELIVTNARHHSALLCAIDSLQRAREGIDSGISADFIAQDVREAIHHLASLTGQISTDDLLGNIFANFCIGK